MSTQPHLPTDAKVIITGMSIEAGELHLRPGAQGQVLYTRTWRDETTGRPMTNVMAEFDGKRIGLWPHECRVIGAPGPPQPEIHTGGAERQMTLWDA